MNDEQLKPENETQDQTAIRTDITDNRAPIVERTPIVERQDITANRRPPDIAHREDLDLRPDWGLDYEE